MTADQLVDWLAHSSAPQREKLATMRARYVATVRDLDDDDHRRVVRELKRRLSSRKLANELAALLAEIARDRVPRPGIAAPLVDDLPPADRELQAQLETAIADDPDAQAPYLPYADWLEARGDAFGPLVAIDRQLANNPGHEAVQRARSEYLASHARALLGPLVDCGDVITGIEWHMGFIRRCRIARARGRGHALPDVAFSEVLRWLLDEPGPGRFVQHLSIAHEPKRSEPAPAAIAARIRPALRTLILEWQEVAGMAALWPALPNLRELHMRTGLCDAAELALAAAALPRLERLYLTAGELDRHRMRAIASATWPSLELLDIDANFDDGREPFQPDDVAPLLDGVHAPRLARLALRCAYDGDALCERIVASPRFHQLTALDLSRGTIGERGAQTLLAHPDALARLELVLDENWVPAALCAALAAAARSVSLVAQRDDGGDPSRRFVTVQE